MVTRPYIRVRGVTERRIESLGALDRGLDGSAVVLRRRRRRRGRRRRRRRRPGESRPGANWDRL